MTLYLTTSTHRRGGNNGNNRAETMQKPTKKSRNNAFLAEKRLTAALGPSGRRFDPCHSDQKCSGNNCFLSIFFVYCEAIFDVYLVESAKGVNQKKINFSIDFLKNCAIIYPKKKGDAVWVTQNSVNL